MRIFILLLFIVFSTNAIAQKQFPPKLLLSKCYGDTGMQDYKSSIKTYDSGFCYIENTVDGNGFGNDSLIKIDRLGIVIWKKNIKRNGYAYMLSNYDSNYSFIFCNLSASNIDSTLIYRFNNAGVIDTFKLIKGTELYTAIKARNGDVILTGWETGANGNGPNDARIVRLNKFGNLLWDKTLGGNGDDYAGNIFELNNGDLVVGGRTSSNNGDFIGNHGFDDIFVAKLDSAGYKKWIKCFGGSQFEELRNIVRKDEHSFFILSNTNSYNGDIVGNHGDSSIWVGPDINEVWLARVDMNGNIIKSRCFGSDGYDGAIKMVQTFDKKGIVISGNSSYSNAGDTYNILPDSLLGYYWVCRFDTSLNLIWTKAIGGIPYGEVTEMWDMIIDDDGSLWGFGETQTNAVDIPDYHFGTFCFNINDCPNSYDVWIFKLDADTIKPYPTMQGYIYTDDNSNSIFDGNDTYKANVKVQLSNGNYTFTDNNGYYQIQADSIGSYTLTVTPPTSYNALPQIVSYTFNTYDTTVTKDIALQQIVTIDSLSVFAVPMVFNAVQGGAMPYWVQYENCGTSVLSPTVYLNYSNYILNYDSCSDANAIATFNGIATAQTNMQPGQMNNFIAYYDVKPTATIGDTLKTVYGISIGTAIAATDSFYMLVEGGSPNADGQRATPSLTAAQVAAGKDIYYTINFKNTGIDTAFNVVITDTLSSLLQANTLQMLSSSHKCKTTVKGNLVTFELLNIKLPKASTNTLRSLGFVSFKVKPKANLTAGTIITNKANTYYNYRLPMSSIATTIIKALVTPVQFANYELRFTNDRQVENKWTTANEINVSHFYIQRSLNGKDSITIGKVKANGAGDNEYSFIDNSPLSTVDSRPSTYYYRIVSVDKDGTLGFSEIKTINYKPQTLNGFSLFPNPTKDFVTISCKGMTEVRIINSLGQEISRQEPRNDVIIINTQSFNKGVYIVQVTTDSGSVKNQKLIIE